MIIDWIESRSDSFLLIHLGIADEYYDRFHVQEKFIPVINDCYPMVKPRIPSSRRRHDRRCAKKRNTRD